MKEITVKTPAKVNLFLDVLARENNGFHSLITLFQAIRIFDIIRIFPSRKNDLTLKPDDIVIEHNIAWDVIDRIKRIRKLDTYFKITIEKNIPMGAGLGGGSSNACGVLLGIDHLLDLKLTHEEKLHIMRAVGSDTAFFLKGGMQFGMHFGEMLDVIEYPLIYSIVLVYPGIAISTRQAYQALESVMFRKGEKKLKAIIRSLEEKNLDYLIDNLYNIFEEIEYQQYSILPEIKKRLKGEGADNALLSGTGATVYGIFKDTERAKKAFKKMEKEYDKVFLTQPWNQGVILC
ncbi:MAG: 4-(cytidine 5'-diphospho)-2-C-methyl-D-erythritol kinase [Spirochaetes bacterium]|nr:4-(cytidine 5'-diphospho)-2-C-methyl-D-erythritol kinase [Spirochaetota bacterium]